MAGLVLREDKDGLATLTLNRPDKLNSINVEMFIELRAHLDAIAENRPRRPRGRAQRRQMLSAGHDLADIAKGAPTAPQLPVGDRRASRRSHNQSSPPSMVIATPARSNSRWPAT